MEFSFKFIFTKKKFNDKRTIRSIQRWCMAIIITTMVLEIKVPLGAKIKDIYVLIPEFVSYLMSFIFVLIYWNSHHHMF